MRNKAKVVKNIFLALTILAIVGLGVFVWKKMPDHFNEMWEYIKLFVLERPMDTKKIIGFGVVLVGLTIGTIWVVRNLRAGRKLYAFVGPILFNALLFFGLVFYRDRFLFQKLSGKGPESENALIFTILAAAVVVFLIATIISVVIEEKKEYKPSFDASKKNIKNEITYKYKAVDPEIHVESTKNTVNVIPNDCDDVRKELLEIKKTVLEIRDLVNEKGLQGRKVLVKKLVTEEIAVDEPEKEKVVSPIPAKEEPVAVLISESDEIKPVDVEEPIEIDVKVNDNDELVDLSVKPIRDKTTTKFVAQEGSNAPKVIRKPFDEKMAEADEVNKTNYNILKNEIMSYGPKSRISHSGDTFRLKRETYAKLSLVGKNLKIYLALNPAEYNDTTIPAKDVSAKKCFEETPTMLHVRSRLSVKRAKLLIAELMKNKELQQGEVKEFDFASEFVAPKKKKAKIVK